MLQNTERIKDLIKTDKFDRDAEVRGWVRTKRGSKSIAFIAVNDGSTIHNIQVVIDVPAFDEDLLKKITTGASIGIKGKLVKSAGKGQTVELQASEVVVYGESDPETYPLQKKGHSMEFLREIAHLRFRTNTFGAVFRIRHTLAFAVHQYFNDLGYYYLHSPIITASDAEGAGETFHVTIFDP
ncbi:MAG: OB-fold nucleic acid binding domain-containing protein, partial [bacterium]